MRMGNSSRAPASILNMRTILGKGIVERKITGGTDLVKTGPCVVDGRCDGGKI